MIWSSDSQVDSSVSLSLPKAAQASSQELLHCWQNQDERNTQGKVEPGDRAGILNQGRCCIGRVWPIQKRPGPGRAVRVASPPLWHCPYVIMMQVGSRGGFRRHSLLPTPPAFRSRPGRPCRHSHRRAVAASPGPHRPPHPEKEPPP